MGRKFHLPDFHLLLSTFLLPAARRGMQKRVLQFLSRNTDAGAEALTPSFIHSKPKQTQVPVTCTMEEDRA